MSRSRIRCPTFSREPGQRVRVRIAFAAAVVYRFRYRGTTEDPVIKRAHETEFAGFGNAPSFAESARLLNTGRMDATDPLISVPKLAEKWSRAPMLAGRIRTLQSNPA